jgi:hypothetical protein
VLASGGGFDTLKGGSGDDEFRIDVTGLTAPTSATDSAHQVKVDTGAGTNQVVLLGLGGTVSQSSLWRVGYLGAAPKELKIEDGTINVSTDLYAPGQKHHPGRGLRQRNRPHDFDLLGGAGGIFIQSAHLRNRWRRSAGHTLDP